MLLGPTGAGKTTTLRLVAGLEKPDEGAVRIGGRDVTDIEPAERDIAFVFQQYSLYPHLSRVRQPGVPAALAGAARCEAEQIRSRVERSPSCCASRTSSATGRPALRAARCSAWPSAGRWCARPAIYLMDEPLSSLDAKLRGELRLELKRIQQDLGATMLYRDA